MRVSFLGIIPKVSDFLFVFVILSILFLTSCSPVSQEPIEYYKGYHGVDLEVESFSDSIRRGSEFPLKVTLTNKGAYDTNIVVQVFYPFPYLSFVSAQHLKVFNSKNFVTFDQSNFKGKNREHPYESKSEGLIRFEANLPEMQSQKTVSLSFDYCYTYSTYVNTPLCINPDYNLNTVEPVCELKPITFSEGQGSIISVSRIEPAEIKEGNKVIVTLRVYLTNHGSGEIASFTPPRTITELKTNCFEYKKDEDITDRLNDLFRKAKIRIKDFKIGSLQITELVGKEISLGEDNSFEIEFTLDRYDGSPYVANLNLEFDFVYIDSESVMVTIQ